MSESEDFSVPGAYLASIPEECRDEAMDIILALKARRLEILQQVEEDLDRIPIERPDNPEDDKDYKKRLGLWMKENALQMRHPSLVFPYVLKNHAAIEKYVRKTVRPTGNVL